MEALPRSPWLIGLLAAVIVAEVIWRRWASRGYNVRAAAASVGIAAGNIVLKPLTAVVPAAA